MESHHGSHWHRTSRGAAGRHAPDADRRGRSRSAYPNNKKRERAENETTRRRDGATTECSWPTMRAGRAKLKSCRDDMILAQGQRGTSAALGSERKMISSPFSGLARQPAGAPNQKKGRWLRGGRYPGRRPRRSCPGLLSMLPLRGAERANRVGGGRSSLAVGPAAENGGAGRVGGLGSRTVTKNFSSGRRPVRHVPENDRRRSTQTPANPERSRSLNCSSSIAGTIGILAALPVANPRSPRRRPWASPARRRPAIASYISAMRQ